MTDATVNEAAGVETKSAQPRRAPSDGSAKCRYWRVARRPHNQKQFPGEYSTRHMLFEAVTQPEAEKWARENFQCSEVVKVEIWPFIVPLSPND